jgi:hypothetical protein
MAQNDPDESAATEAQPDNWLERDASRAVRSVFTNRMFVQALGGDMLRVSFAENLDDDPRYHSAIAISAVNAIEFAQLLYQMGTALLPQPPIQTVQEAPAASEHGDE